MKYLIGLIALALPTYLVRFQIFHIPTTLLELIIYAVFLYGFCNIGYSQWKRGKTNYWLPIGLILLGALISVFIAPDRQVALGAFKAYFVDPVLIFYIILVYLKPADYFYVLGGLFGSGLFVSIHAIIQKITHNVTADGRVVGIFGYSPNYLALFLAPIIMMLAAYSFQLTVQRKYWYLVVSCLLLVVSLSALYLSGSRGSLLALVIGLLFYAIIYYWKFFTKHAWAKFVLVGIIVLGIAAAGYAYRPNFAISGENGGRTATSNNVRFQIWQTSVEMIKKQPILGVGLGNFQNAFNELTHNRVNFPEFITPMALTPHNLFLMYYLTTSLFGLIGFLWLLVFFTIDAFRVVNKSLGLVLFSAMIVIMAQGFVDTPYFKNDLSLLFWLITAGIIITRKKNEKNNNLPVY